jgi:hypothetical protein
MALLRIYRAEWGDSRRPDILIALILVTALTGLVGATAWITSVSRDPTPRPADLPPVAYDVTIQVQSEWGRWSAEDVFFSMMVNLGNQFPVDGLPDDPQLGQSFLVEGRPVMVVSRTSRSLALLSLPVDGHGGWNLLNLAISADGRNLTVSGRGPAVNPYPLDLVPGHFWDIYANNVRFAVDQTQWERMGY